MTRNRPVPQVSAEDAAFIRSLIIYDDDQVINVCNAPSPAATSSLAIGDTISDMVIR